VRAFPNNIIMVVIMNLNTLHDKKDKPVNKTIYKLKSFTRKCTQITNICLNDQTKGYNVNR